MIARRAGHLTDEELIGYVLETLPDETVAALERHLTECAECADTVEDSLIARGTALPVDPAAAERVRDVLAQHRGRHRDAWFRVLAEMAGAPQAVPNEAFRTSVPLVSWRLAPSTHALLVPAEDGAWSLIVNVSGGSPASRLVRYVVSDAGGGQAASGCLLLQRDGPVWSAGTRLGSANLPPRCALRLEFVDIVDPVMAAPAVVEGALAASDSAGRGAWRVWIDDRISAGAIGEEVLDFLGAGWTDDEPA